VIQQERRLREFLPAGRVHLSGSAFAPGPESDDVVLVDGVAAAADDSAAFRNPGRPQVDIVLTRPGPPGDKHHRHARGLLSGRPDLEQEYRELEATPQDYERRKREFFERVVAQL
jgi:hypothetical protein